MRVCFSRARVSGADDCVARVTSSSPWLNHSVKELSAADGMCRVTHLGGVCFEVGFVCGRVGVRVGVCVCVWACGCVYMGGEYI